MLLAVLAMIATFAPASAFAGLYKVDVCTARVHPGQGLIYFREAGTVGLENRECGTPPLSSEEWILQSGPRVGPASGVIGWTLESPLGETIHQVNFGRSFSTSEAGNSNLTWTLSSGIGVVHLDRYKDDGSPPPPFEFASYIVDSRVVRSTVGCIGGGGCGDSLFFFKASEISVVLEDPFRPQIAPTAPVLTVPLRGAVRIPYRATDSGGGVALRRLVLDESAGHPGTVLATQQDPSGGSCEEPYLAMSPCRLQIQDEFTLDTTQIPDGVHTVTLVATDAGGNLSLDPPIQIVVHNRPTNTRRPALSGVAKVGETLSATNGEWDGAPASFAHLWLRCPPDVSDGSQAGCTEIAGASAETYAATAADVGMRLMAVVRASNAAGPELALSPASAPVAAKDRVPSGGPGGGGGAGGGNATPPQTRLARHPRRKTALRAATFAFASDQPGSSFQCKLDRAPFKPCRSTFRRRVRPGRHSLRVRAVNSAGLLDPTPAVFRWKVS